MLTSSWLWLAVAVAEEPEVAPPDPAVLAAFVDVVSVLQSPRCVNCHPDGDVPTVRDRGEPHAMGITRRSPEVGLPCSTCHREVGFDGVGHPPADAHWGLPPRNQVFEGRSVTELCAQLNDPEQTGDRDLEALLEHVSGDPLVLWGFAPGGARTVPPLTHPQFVAAFTAWVEAEGPCP